MQRIKRILTVSTLSIVFSAFLFSQASTDQTKKFFYHGAGVDTTKFSGIKALTGELGKPITSNVVFFEKETKQSRIVIKNIYRNCVTIVSLWYDSGEFELERIESVRDGNYLFGLNELASLDALIEKLGLKLKTASQYKKDEKRIYGFIYESEKNVYYVPIENREGLYVYCDAEKRIQSIHWQFRDY